MSWDGRSLGEPEVILDGIPKAGIHDGGRIIVGPDGHLYVGTGDSGESQEAQDKSSLGGKILRVTVDGEPAPGNPFGDEVFSFGHRNVQGLAFDEEGRLWACEFGSQDWDELNLIEKGKNYGWPLVEGSGEGQGLTNPKVVWRTSEASPSGLAYWQGDLWMAGLRGERLWQIPVDGTDTGDPVAHFEGEYGRLRTVVVSSDGQSLLLTGSNTDGRGDVRDGDDRLGRSALPARTSGRLSRSSVAGQLLDRPAVPIGIGEVDERPPRLHVHLAHRAQSPADELLPRGLDVGHHHLQALQRPRSHRGDPLADTDRTR